MTDVLADLPPLVVVRGWSEAVNPDFIIFMQELREAGHEVIDIFSLPTGYRDFGQWADDVIAEIERRTPPGRPLHLIGYCYGGNLLMNAVTKLESRGADLEYVGFIDVRRDSPGMRLTRGLDALYQVPWPVRIRQQLIRLVPPSREPFSVVASSVLRRAVRSVVELPKRGWRSRRRRIPAIHEQLALSLAWEFDWMSTPVHFYVSPDSMERYAPGDPSLGHSIRLRGGCAVRFIEGTHESCICPPNSAELIERITTDRFDAARRIGLQL